MGEYFNTILTYITSDKLFENDFAIAGVISAIFYAGIGYVKPLPIFIWSRIRRLLVYSTSIEQSSELYVMVSQHIAEKYPHKLRNVEAFLADVYGSGDTGDEDTADDKSVKYRHYSDFIIIRKGLHFIKMEKSREKLENARDFTQAYLGRMTFSGFFAKSAIQAIINEAYVEAEKTKNSISYKKYSWDSHYWSSCYEYGGKDVDRMFFPEKKKILQRVDEFQSSKDFYTKRGIDWYLGICLEGQPGSGKSTFAKALAKYTKRNLYNINLASLSDSSFLAAFRRIGKNAILVLDDIDITLASRDDDKKTGVSLPTLLNCLDGSMSRSDLIVVMTTNNPEKLDHALVRKGRIDIFEKVSYPDYESVVGYVSNFFEEDVEKVKKLLIDVNTTRPMVEIQDICIENKNNFAAAANAIRTL